MRRVTIMNSECPSKHRYTHPVWCFPKYILIMMMWFPNTMVDRVWFPDNFFINRLCTSSLTMSIKTEIRGLCSPWLIHMCDMTHPYVWHDSFICVTWLIHMC